MLPFPNVSQGVSRKVANYYKFNYNSCETEESDLGEVFGRVV
jgi:hypothetical protein